MPAHNRWLAPAEAERLDAMRFTKRRDESRLGRWTAKHAVARTLDRPRNDADLARIVIRNDRDGAPSAFIGDDPAPVSISMTDRAGWAVCAVGAGGDALGCDLELVEPRTQRFVADWFTPAEQSAVAAAPKDHDLLANLIWSAKESALKVLHEGLRLDTRSVEVSLRERERSGWQALVVTTARGAEFPGWWVRYGDFILTCCGVAPFDPPISMDAPAPLADATPTHSWLADPDRSRLRGSCREVR